MSTFDEVVAGAVAPARPVTWPPSMSEVLDGVNLLSTLAVCALRGDEAGFWAALEPYRDRPDVLAVLLQAEMFANAEVLKERNDG